MTTRRELEDLVARLADATGATLTLARYQPGDSRTPYRIEDDRGGTPYGARRRSAGELADCLRFALAAIGTVPTIARDEGELLADVLADHIARCERSGGGHHPDAAWEARLLMRLAGGVAA